MMTAISEAPRRQRTTWRVFISFAIALSLLAGQAHAACNLIPQTEKSFESVLGAVTRPFAAPGEPLELRLRPCDAPANIDMSATSHLVTVIFTPTGSGPKNAVVLTAAGDCSAITPAMLTACETQLGAGSVATCVSGAAAGMQVVPRNMTNYLRFTFPDTDSLVQGAADRRTLTGPATVVVTGSTPAALPCQLATQSCAAQSGLTACIDDFFANDGTCGRAAPEGTFNHFTALPPPNDFQADCWDTSPPCALSGDPDFRVTTDRDGNVLMPMDWRGILVKQNQVPVPRLLRATLAPPLSLQIPGKSFVASYTPEGGLLPPIFEPQADPSAPSGIATLFGSADAPYTVLRLARRSATFQQCSDGTNAGLPCNDANDCPGGSCAATVCFAGGRAGLPCNGDALCPGGECGPQVTDLRALGVGGNGPVVVNRLGAGVCQADNDLTCSMDTPDCTGIGPCVNYALTAENPVPLEGLALSPEVFAFAVNEGIDNVDRNGDDDKVDTIVTLRDRVTGQGQALGAPPLACGITGTPEGRAVIRTQQTPFSFPAVATEGNVVAFLESEAITNAPPLASPHLACDMNGDGDTADAILRVFKLASGEVVPAVTNPVADGALLVNGRALAVSNGRVFFRSPEAGNATQHTKRVNLDSMDNQVSFGELWIVGGSSGAAMLSDDGRYITFESNDTAIVPGANGFRNIYVRDLRLGTNELISVSTAGMNPNSHSYGQAISADGRWVVFSTNATNLGTAVVPPCSNVTYGMAPCEQIMLRDRCVSNGIAVPGCTPSTLDVSVDSMGNAANDHNEEPSISADGRFIAFRSWATNLVVPDTVNCSSKLYVSGPCPDIFVRDRCVSNGVAVPGCTPNSRRASAASDGTPANQGSELAVISANGRVVVFETAATNLGVPAGLVVHDLDTGITEYAALDSFGNPAAANFASISADGRFVAFQSNAVSLVPGDTNGLIDEFVHDRLTGATDRVSVDSNGHDHTGPGSGSGPGFLSADGRFVVFQSDNTDLVPSTPGGLTHVYVHDRATGVTQIADVNASGAPADAGARSVAISGDGRTVTWYGSASNLVLDDTNGTSDVFTRGLDLSSPSGDLSGDGQADDTILRIVDSNGGAVTTLCPAGQVSVSAGAAAFLRPEAAGATSNSDCTGATLSGPDLNGDGDSTDSVVHYAPAGGAVQNLQRAASAVVLSSVCAGGTRVARSCSADEDCPSSTCTPAFVSALVSEADQNHTNLNADNDATPSDTVVQIYDLTAATPHWTNIGQAGDSIDAAGSLVAFLTPEADQNADLNGDGDKTDRVLQVVDANTNARTNTHQAAEEFVMGGDLGACGNSPLVAFRTSEAAQGNTNLNGDLNTTDYVLQVYAKGLGVINTGQAVTPCLLEACDPRLPYRVYGSKVKFLTYEVEQGRDLNGDGDATDLILQVFDACTRETTVISSVDTSNTSTGSLQDPLAQDPTTEGHAVITPSKRCVQGGMTTLLVPSTCNVTADCPASSTCTNELVVAAPGAVPHDDTVLLPLKPLTITIPNGATEIVKTISVKARNADLLPTKDRTGHLVRISVAPGDCPALLVDNLADFDGKTPGEQDSVLLKGGQAKTAKVRLRVKALDFATHSSKAPARCTLQVTASTVLVGNEDPTPANNVQSLELNIIDKNDLPASYSGTTHESVLKSAVPVKLTISKTATSATKTVSVKVGNADILPTKEDPGHAIALSVDSSTSTCRAGTVTVNPPSSLTVKGGSSGMAKVTVNVNKDDFKAANAKSLGRCTAVLTATTSVIGNIEPNSSNNSTHLLIDVNDKTDY
jgi:hypothetical protein